MPEAEKQQKRPRLRLPFENRKTDIGEWAYEHRIGLCVMVVVYLLLGILFVGTKILIGSKPSSQGMYIDIQTLAELEQEKARLEREVQQRQQQQNDPIDWGSIKNQASNENGLDENLKDDRGTNASAINESADAANNSMKANREAYERGLAEAQAIRSGKGGEKMDGEQKDRKIKGRVTVSFSLTDPIRYKRNLIKPAYQCEGGGEVAVEISVNQSGEVVAARVLSGGDDCMRETALNAARRSTFNIDTSAPAKQIGTITYIFIPQ